MNKGLLSVDEALAQLLAGAVPVADVEDIPALEASGRVLARAQRSTMDVPPLDNSAMDGYAVRTKDVVPGARLRVTQKIMAGMVGRALEPGSAARIFTGAPIPPGADAVVMQEDTQPDDDFVSIKKLPKSGEWVRYVGSDIRKGTEILPAGKRLAPQDTGLAASVGIRTLPVYRKARVGLFFTGDELVMPGEPLAFGKVGAASFIGLPGNPVSSFVTFLVFVRPFLLKLQGHEKAQARVVAARADFDWLEPDVRREFLRARWNAQGGLELYPTQDSAVLTSTVWADGLIDNPAGHAIRKGEAVRFLPYSELMG